MAENTKIYYPTNDYCFKRLFGHKGNERITQGLIEAILENKCKVVRVKSDEVTEKDLGSDKLGVLDVFVEQDDGTKINLEMQMIKYELILKRILFYWAQKYIEGIQEGQTYKALKPTKVILIANFEIKELEKLKEIANSFKIMDKKTGKVILTEELEIVIIELPKMKKYKIENRELEIWLEFIKNPNSLGAKDMDKNKALKEAKKEYEKIIADEHERSLIKLREKYMLDYNTLREESLERGMREGYEEGHEIGQKEGYETGQKEGYETGQKEGYETGQKEGYETGQKEGYETGQTEIAKNLLSMGMSIEDIEKATGLTKEEIEKLNTNK